MDFINPYVGHIVGPERRMRILLWANEDFNIDVAKLFYWTCFILLGFIYLTNLWRVGYFKKLECRRTGILICSVCRYLLVGSTTKAQRVGRHGDAANFSARRRTTEAAHTQRRAWFTHAQAARMWVTVPEAVLIVFTLHSGNRTGPLLESTSLLYFNNLIMYIQTMYEIQS